MAITGKTLLAIDMVLQQDLRVCNTTPEWKQMVKELRETIHAELDKIKIEVKWDGEKQESHSKRANKPTHRSRP